MDLSLPIKEMQYVHQTADAVRRTENYFFPKITGKHQEFLAALRRLRDDGKVCGEIELEGTIKLHGMHADILYDLSNESVAFPTFQSRNRVLSSGGDCQGWPRSITCIEGSMEAFEYLKQKILTRFRERNPGTSIDKSLPLIVAGEWIGGNVQKNVGISQLSKRFVILSIKLNGIWQKDEDYAAIEVVRAGIYSIFRGQQTKLKFDTLDITEDNPTLFEMQRLADCVESSCPFAAAFGIKSARGEGVVWKPGIAEARADARYWLKTKGPISGKENRIDQALIAEDRVKNATIDQLCEKWVSPRRIEQGFEYLNEMRIDPTPKSLKEYQNWMLHDVTAEEHWVIENLKARYPDVEKFVKKKVERLSRDAYIAQANECSVHLA